METLTKEKVKRRWRNHRQPTGRVELQERDIWGVLRPIYEHGQLARPQIEAFCAPYGIGEKSGMGMRLTALFHQNNEHGGPYLRRVAEHPELPDFARHAIYDVTPFAEQALEEAQYSPSKRSFDLEFDPHRFMISCTGASLETAVNEDPKLKWESRIQILSEAPGKVLRIPCVISHNGYTSKYGLMPDDLFGIEYEEKHWRIFAVECDRGNEPYERANLDETSLHAKYLRYEKIIEGGTYETRPYKKHYGRKCGMVVLFIFNRRSKMEEFLKRVEEWHGGPCTWILAMTIPCFGKNLSIPPVMRELATGEWERAGYKPVRITDVQWNQDLMVR